MGPGLNWNFSYMLYSNFWHPDQSYTMSETSTHTNVYQIEPLTGAENYAVWRIKIMDILTGQYLWEYAEGPVTQPSEVVAKAAWNKKDRLVLSTIWLRVADKMLVYIASLKTVKEAWDALKSLLKPREHWGLYRHGRNYSDHNVRRTHQLKNIFRHLHSYQEELHNLGKKIDGEELSIILLTPLPKNWNNYIASIDTTDLKDASKLIVCILEPDQQLSPRNSNDMASAGKHGKKKVNPNITCYKCGEKEHISWKCKKKSNLERGNCGGNNGSQCSGRWRICILWRGGYSTGCFTRILAGWLGMHFTHSTRSLLITPWHQGIKFQALGKPLH